MKSFIAILKSPTLLFTIITLLLLNSCELVGGIFEAGVWVGVIISAIVVGLIVFLLIKLLKKMF